VVGPDSVESAVDVGWDGACYFEVVDVAFEEAGFVHGEEDRSPGEADGGGGCEAVGGVVWEVGEEVVDVGHCWCWFMRLLVLKFWLNRNKSDCHEVSFFVGYPGGEFRCPATVRSPA
jgi:hypothetical protein